MPQHRKSIFRPAKNANASGPHKAVLKLLQAAFSGYSILEEQRIEANVMGKPQQLPVDLVIKEFRVAIEVQGEQHFTFNPHFHRSMADFEQQQRRDRAKAEAIVEAGWAYIAVRHDEIEKLTPTVLANRITQAIVGSNQ
jgi:hypothetical protein